MFIKFFKQLHPKPQAMRRAIRACNALPNSQQTLAAVYAQGIRDGLQIAVDIREKSNRCREVEQHGRQ